MTLTLILTCAKHRQTIFIKNAICILLFFASKFPYQIMDETPELAKGAAKAVFELYHVVTHDLLSSELRYAV